ncbi:MAG: PA2778 family cysteine peptidase [Gammaproteobacteria bacterium]
MIRWMTISVAFLLGACASGPDLRGLRTPDEPLHAYLRAVPFHAQTVAPGGAESLAMALQAGGAHVSPDALGAATETEMLATPHRHGFVSYPAGGSLTALLLEIDAGHPVIVRRTRPDRAFVVVVGYDLERNELIAHLPAKRAARISIERFDRDWERSDRWAMVTLPPDTVPAAVSPRTALSAIHDFERVVGEVDAMPAWVAATEAWPEQAVAWFARANAHAVRRELSEARDAYLAAVALAPGLEPAWLELGLLYSELGERGNALAALQAAMMIGGPWQSEAKAAFDEVAAHSPLI